MTATHIASPQPNSLSELLHRYAEYPCKITNEEDPRVLASALLDRPKSVDSHARPACQLLLGEADLFTSCLESLRKPGAPPCYFWTNGSPTDRKIIPG